MPRVPVYDDEWASTHICVWDAAAAHLLLEDAIRRIPDEAAGKGFLITGNGLPWRSIDISRAVKVLSIGPVFPGETDSQSYIVLCSS